MRLPTECVLHLVGCQQHSICNRTRELARYDVMDALDIKPSLDHRVRGHAECRGEYPYCKHKLVASRFCIGWRSRWIKTRSIGGLLDALLAANKDALTFKVDKVAAVCVESLVGNRADRLWLPTGGGFLLGWCSGRRSGHLLRQGEATKCANAKDQGKESHHQN